MLFLFLDVVQNQDFDSNEHLCTKLNKLRDVVVN